MTVTHEGPLGRLLPPAGMLNDGEQIIGAAQLLIRRLPAGTPERNAAQVIMQEAERMANLVRKIGKITRYETKSYVGDQRILDLDRATDEEPETST